MSGPMRIAIDTLGSPTESGGMRAYVDELVDAWATAFPTDRLLVIGYDYVSDLAGDGVEVAVRPESGRHRIWGQWVTSGRLARSWGADVLLSLSSVVSPVFPRSRRVCTVHDWRHRVSPSEFGTLQRAYRRSWQWSLEHAAATVAISTKTVRETSRFAPRARTTLIENGRDHARHWEPAPPSTVAQRPQVLTFGHFPNKRAELVIDAVAEIGVEIDLVVLGARAGYAEALRSRAEDRGVGGRVSFPGFVDTRDYRSLIQGSSVVVLASSDEGFGLPVAEANYFGIPCVVTSDGGLPEIHGDRALSADATPRDLGAAIEAALARTGNSAGARADGTWAETAGHVRALCAGLT